jgi:hypothetical protein
VSKKVWTAAELERMSPTQQDEIFQASIVRDLDDVSPEFLARIRARVERQIAASESTRPDDG